MAKYLKLALGIILLGASIYVLTEWFMGIYGLAIYTSFVGFGMIDSCITKK
jgi:general stress protein CsbA